MPEHSLSNIYFLSKVHHNLLMLRSTSQHLNTMLGVILNREITTTNKKSTENAESMARNRPHKGHLFTA